MYDNNVQQNNINYDQPVVNNQNVSVNNGNGNQNAYVSKPIQTVEYADAGVRLLSFLKGFLILFGISFFVFMIGTFVEIAIHAASIFNNTQIPDSNTFLYLIHILIPTILIPFGYPIVYFVGCLSETHTSKGLWKKGYVVLNEDGSELTIGQAIGRGLIFGFTYLCGLMLVSLITMAVTDKKQGLHDLILKQVVVKKY